MLDKSHLTDKSLHGTNTRSNSTAMTTLNAKMIMDSVDFNDLPIDKSHPHHSAWLWGPDDGLGTLNYLTPEIVVQAAREIRSGERACLNWDMRHPTHPGFGRQQFSHDVFQRSDRTVCDDTVHFNTQHSSQWDGFRHFGYQKEKVFYNNTTMEQILHVDGESCSAGMEAGMAEWAKKGISGRGVLLDIYGYCTAHGLEYDPWTTHAITLDVILACAKHQKVAFRKGDVLILRTGYHVSYEKATVKQIKAKSEVNPPAYAGVEQDLEIARWIYDNKFAAVAGDAPAFESWPADTNKIGCALHEIFLGGWGMPIGEMWYLEELLNLATTLDRWTFFLSSSPLNVPNGVASPPNIMAIF
ncbi:Putative uncharacterized protein [Taphrina deformans PYCC 5710]|uniref:Cyclase n=1 Tax=Taphrina deformans (strain PYCC 5710 / ATCC 11124 / CBS 356.35 / IMI 108563 / JCM 9778 / NBRC 8474) TaxID=1097556 RepID=R4XEB7_TAPDE|nr:Putative uncharacterized protein [Taphrina deformans PYCC 5710]|eukprot:CCG81707.1 Putative uncharacterized protein [Taphrina deformans PYCC 5710]